MTQMTSLTVDERCKDSAGISEQARHERRVDELERGGVAEARNAHLNATQVATRLRRDVIEQFHVLRKAFQPT